MQNFYAFHYCKVKWIFQEETHDEELIAEHKPKACAGLCVDGEDARRAVGREVEGVELPRGGDRARSLPLQPAHADRIQRGRSSAGPSTSIAAKANVGRELT